MIKIFVVVYENEDVSMNRRIMSKMSWSYGIFSMKLEKKMCPLSRWCRHHDCHIWYLISKDFIVEISLPLLCLLSANSINPKVGLIVKLESKSNIHIYAWILWNPMICRRRCQCPFFSCHSNFRSSSSFLLSCMMLEVIPKWMRKATKKFRLYFFLSLSLVSLQKLSGAV